MKHIVDITGPNPNIKTLYEEHEPGDYVEFPVSHISDCNIFVQTDSVHLNSTFKDHCTIYSFEMPDWDVFITIKIDNSMAMIKPTMPTPINTRDNRLYKGQLSFPTPPIQQEDESIYCSCGAKCRKSQKFCGECGFILIKDK